MQPADLEQLAEIDGTVESRQYLHLGREGAGLVSAWKLEQRDLREKLVEPNRLADEARFAYRQVVGGIEEGAALAVEVEGAPVAALVAVAHPQLGTLQLVDLRVDYDYRRQGFATALLYQLIAAARQRGEEGGEGEGGGGGGVRAIYAEVAANNSPAQQLLERLGFTLSGFDERRRSNHDLVKETATLLWYLELEA
jgi:ribosomal protein S18 acetylase RimI-like enzyme